MKTRPHAITAVFRRNFHAFFANPTGYVFITMFIAATAFLAFSREMFFAANIADLSALNQYFLWLPVVFIPAIAMNTWAEERKLGTDELMLTLPVHDLEVVLGKYLAALAVYTVSLVFALSHGVVIEVLGNPDWGLLTANYLGYWLVGAALIPLAMAASALTANVTVAFILGTVLCAGVVFAQNLLGGLFGLESRVAGAVGVESHFRNFTLGVITLDDVVYFVALAVVALYLNMVLMGRRHWLGARKRHMVTHYSMRAVSLLVIGVSLSVLAGRWVGGARIDATVEDINSLPAEAHELLSDLPGDAPVYVEAFISPEVPQEYVTTREDMLRLLRHIDTIGGRRVRVITHDTRLYSDEAERATERFDITPRNVQVVEGGRMSADSIYLGVAMRSGPNEEVIRFVDRGSPVAYELVRTLRAVTKAKRKTIGILETDLPVMGRFNMQTGQRTPDWQVVEELRAQYDVVPVQPEELFESQVDVLLAPLPSSLTQPQMNMLSRYVQSGAPTLMLVDPYPYMNPWLSPQMPKRRPGQNPMMQRQMGQKGDIGTMLQDIGVSWNPTSIVWDTYNPMRRVAAQPPEIVFISDKAGGTQAFNPKQPSTRKLERVVLIFGGVLEEVPGSQMEFTPLMRTSASSGLTNWMQLQSPTIQHNPTGDSYVMAARVEGNPAPDPTAAPTAGGVQAIVVADTDIISDIFFMVRRQGNREYRFDNVDFVLNCVDQLAGDMTLVKLRNRRPGYRTLTMIEEITKKAEQARMDLEDTARTEAEERMTQAQERFDRRLEQILEEQRDLYGTATEIQLLREAEQKKLEATREQIERRKEQAIAEAEQEMQQSIRRIENSVRLWALVLPPLPAIFIGLLVLLWQVHREKEGTPLTRSMRQV